MFFNKFTITGGVETDDFDTGSSCNMDWVVLVDIGHLCFERVVVNDE